MTPEKRDRLLLGLFLAAMALLVLVNVLYVAVANAECPSPAVVAHRGDTTTGHTEESLPAYVSAAERGADFIEADVQESSNGVLYAMHDLTLARTVKGSPSGSIASHTSTEINAMRLLDGSRIPHVSEVLAAVKPYGIGAFLEIKAPGPNTYANLRLRVIEFGTTRAIVNSFRTADLDAYHAIAPYQILALDSSPLVPVATASRYDGVLLRYTTATDAYVAALHDANVRLYVWTVNTADAWAALPPCLDGVLTDDLGVAP